MSIQDRSDEFNKWLCNPDFVVDVFECQDAPWLIADQFSVDELLQFESNFRQRSKRRDVLLFAIVVKLIGMLDPSESHENQAEADKSNLMKWLMGNADEVRRIDNEYGFGLDYETYLLPLLAGKK